MSPFACAAHACRSNPTNLVLQINARIHLEFCNILPETVGGLPVPANAVLQSLSLVTLQFSCTFRHLQFSQCRLIMYFAVVQQVWFAQHR